MKVISCAFNFLNKLKINSTILSCENLTCIISTHRNINIPSNIPPSDNLLPKSGKYFQEKENEYAHKVMENLSVYSNSILKYPLQVEKYALRSQLPSENLNAVDEFIKLTIDNMSRCLSIEDQAVTNVIENVCFSLPQASDEDIKRILHYLCLWPTTHSIETRNFHRLWKMLDRECVRRLKHWDMNEKLLIADYWFYLRLSRISRYNQEVIYSLMHNIDSLLNYQIVQLMFYINLQRNIPALFLSNLENKLESVINFVTLEEVGIICLGFFKTKSKILDPNVIRSILKKFMYNVEGVNTITIAAVLKFLRKSINRSLTDSYILALHRCVSCVNSWDIPTSVHLALLSSECNVYHPLLLNCVSEKLVNEMTDARIKDCAKLLLCLSLFNHFQNSFIDLFVSELLKEERQNEFNLYPVHVVHAAMYFAYLGHFNYELLAKLFKKQFYEETCLKYPEVCIVFSELDCCVEIECQDYTGPKLDTSVRKVLGNRRGNVPSYSQKLSLQARLLDEVHESLIDILGSEKNILIRHILPHLHSPDVIVRLTNCKNKSLTDLYYDYSSDHILRPPSNEVWAAFVIGSFFSFAYKSVQVTGITAMKLRQLKIIGYEVVFLPYFNISHDKSQRKKFLQMKLNELDENIRKQSNISNI